LDGYGWAVEMLSCILFQVAGLLGSLLGCCGQLFTDTIAQPCSDSCNHFKHMETIKRACRPPPAISSLNCFIQHKAPMPKTREQQTPPEKLTPIFWQKETSSLAGRRPPSAL
jgi:hypothetical protein